MNTVGEPYSGKPNVRFNEGWLARLSGPDQPPTLPYRGKPRERYLFEYEPAWPSEVVSKSLVAPILRRRATEIAITLSSEPLNVRRVSRWRRHHPTAEWERLRGWLKDPEIRNAVQRLDRMGLPGRPGLIIR